MGRLLYTVVVGLRAPGFLLAIGWRLPQVLEALHSSQPCDSLHIRAACLFKASRRLSARWSLTEQNTIPSLCPILLVRSKSQVSLTFKRRELYKLGHWGHLRVCPS